MIRLLKTPIIGPRVAIVDSSWIDMLAGLVISGILRTPPDFCAAAGAANRTAAHSAAKAFRNRRIVYLPADLLLLRQRVARKARPAKRNRQRFLDSGLRIQVAAGGSRSAAVFSFMRGKAPSARHDGRTSIGRRWVNSVRGRLSNRRCR